MGLVLLIGYLFILRQITVAKGMEYIDLVSVWLSGTPGLSVGRVGPQRKDGSVSIRMGDNEQPKQ